MIAFASASTRPGRSPATSPTPRCCCGTWSGRTRNDSTSLPFPDPIALPTRRAPDGLRLGVPVGARRGEGIEPGVREAFAKTVALAEELGASVETRPRFRTRPTRWPPTTSSPRPRPAPTWPATTACATACASTATTACWRCTRARAPRASAPRSSGGSCSAPTRCRAATTTPTTAAPRRCARRSPRTSARRSSASTSSSRRPRPTVAFTLGEKTDDPLAMYLNDYCTVPMPLAGHARRSRSPTGCPRACRSASRSPARRSARTATPRRRLRARAGDRLRRGGGARMSTPGWEPVIGLEIHVQLATRTKMFCGCALSFGDPPNTHTCPVCLGLPGALPVINAAAVHYGADDRAGARLRDRRALDLPPQELLLSRQLRRRTRSPSTRCPCARGGRLGDVRITRVHLEEDAAKLVHIGDIGPHPRRRREHRRLQPRRHAADRDRHRARPALGRAGARVAQLLRATLRQLGVSRREHGGGLAARRRQRVRAPGGHRRARHQDRAEEHELVPLPRARDRGRDRSASASASTPAGEVEQETLHFDPRAAR